MYRYLLVLALFIGCASFKPIDLRPEDPPELGDLYGFESTTVRYRVIQIDPSYVESTSPLACLNTVSDSRGMCENGDVCLAMKRVDSSTDRTQEPLCMRQEYVMEIYRIENRANGYYNRR